MEGTPKYRFALMKKQSGPKALATVSDGALSGKNDGKSQLSEVHERCYTDLLDLCRTIAAQRNVTMASIMNMQALKAMSEQLPLTEQDMCSIPHVTKANFDKYGAKLLEITCNYASGDFRQTLPVIPRSTYADEINACLKSSRLWRNVERIQLTVNVRVQTLQDPSAETFSKQLLDIGNGKVAIGIRDDNQ
ncbi:Bloom syndrome protein homolog [Drosophila willistoni]|uniref:Bloom syndrome protein homolog n=1 Tax=Drosophila willistoni TaxID=7260 RepID=UPI001F0790A1|nr:Bloom syndrome protein homolog [Drosophila willistoni]